MCTSFKDGHASDTLTSQNVSCRTGRVSNVMEEKTLTPSSREENLIPAGPGSKHRLASIMKKSGTVLSGNMDGAGGLRSAA